MWGWLHSKKVWFGVVAPTAKCKVRSKCGFDPRCLQELLELRGQAGEASAPPATRAARGFLPLLAESEDAFEEVFCLGEAAAALHFTRHSRCCWPPLSHLHALIVLLSPVSLHPPVQPTGFWIGCGWRLRPATCNSL